MSGTRRMENFPITWERKQFEEEEEEEEDEEEEEEEEEEKSVLARRMTEVSPYRVLHYAVANSLLKLR